MKKPGCPICQKKLTLVDKGLTLECPTETYDKVLMGFTTHYQLESDGDISIHIGGDYWISQSSFSINDEHKNKMIIHKVNYKPGRRHYEVITVVESFEIKSEEQLLNKLKLITLFS